MNFFDEDPKNFQQSAQYYFNVLVKTIAIHPNLARQIFNTNIEEIFFIDKITSPRPNIIYCFIDDELDEDTEFEIEYFPHCVVEVSEITGVTCYDMLDFDTDDPWRIDLDEEEFDNSL